jgi:hypothetical protein
MLDRPAWVRACICMHDALALAEFVRGVRPRRVLEIGTASGVSAAALLWSMHTVACGDAGAPWVESFDIVERCYFDQSRPIGSAASEMVPSLTPRLALHTGTARDAARVLAPRAGQFQLAFIDACHDHPWPTLDVLWIAPLLAPGAWVILHDVSYARILDAKRAREGRPPKRSEYGPEALFEAWPFAKVVGDGRAGNIGALRVDDPAVVTADLLRASLVRLWERPMAGEIGAITAGWENPAAQRHAETPGP